MDQTSFTRVLNLLQLPFLLLLPLTFIIILRFRSPSSTRKSLPPGPKPWPIIGNILQMGKKPHISMADLAKIHGPLFSLRLGRQLLIVGSSKMAATEILKTNDRLLSGRYISKMSPYESDVLDRVALASAPKLTGGWKSSRALCRNELFSDKAIALQATLREKKIGEMVEVLGCREGKIVNIGEVLFSTVLSTLSTLFFSEDIIASEENGAVSELKSLMERMIQLVTTPNVADFYPIFARLDPQGLKRKLTECVEEMFAVWGVHIKERRKRHIHDAPRHDFLDVCLVNGFDDLHINWLIMELLFAGADTTTKTVEWIMTELLRNKEAMEKLREELQREKKESSFKDNHVSQLPYLNACVKETLRLHPPSPFLIPRCALETCEVMNYTIPKGSQIIVNVWAIGRDPLLWTDPLSFKPERFLDSNMDFKGQHYEFLPFGGGRRICAGLPMAIRQVHLIVANLIDSFEWSLPNGEDPQKLDMNEKFGSTLRKEQPLLVVPKRKF